MLQDILLNADLTYLPSQALSPVITQHECENRAILQPSENAGNCTFSGKQSCRGRYQTREPRLSGLPGDGKTKRWKHDKGWCIEMEGMQLKHWARLQSVIWSSMRVMQCVSDCGLKAVFRVRIRKVPHPCSARRMQQSWTRMAWSDTEEASEAEEQRTA